MIAESMYVPNELYKNFVPGSFFIVVARKPFIQLLSRAATIKLGSGSIPSDIISTSLTVSSARKGVTGSGKSFGKNDTTLSFNERSFSFNAKQIAVAVKLLLHEYKLCLNSARYGFHHPSAITFPCRKSIKL